MTAMLPLHLLFLFLLVVEPVLGRLAYRRFLSIVRENVAARRRYYAAHILAEWLAVAVMASIMWSAGFSAADLGLGPIRFSALGPGDSGSGGLGSTFGLALLIALLAPLVLVRVSAVYRRRAVAALQRLRPLLPTTPAERRLFAAFSLTAGVCEELVYRSFVCAYLWLALDASAAWALIVFGSAVVFGLAHIYQGWRGVLGATALGFVFAAIYAFTGSVLPSMVLHAGVDLRMLGLLHLLPKEPAPATT